MADVQIKLAGLWIAMMLTYLLGDVLRIFAGDTTPGELAGVKATQGMWLGIAMIMLIPIIMLVLSLIMPQSVNRWANIIVSIGFVVFNLFGLPYPSAFDNFLIVFSFIFNGLIVYYAWTWV